MLEHSILRLFIDDIAIYEKYHSVVKLDFLKQNYPVLHRCFKCLPASSVEGLEANYLANYPVIKEGDRDVIRTLLENVKNAVVEKDAIVAYLETHLSQVWAGEVALTALDVAEGRKQVDLLDSIIAKRESSIVMLADEPEFVTTDIEQLMEEEDTAGGLSWRLKCLNQSLGPLRKGNFGHIFARVETGKTAMWVSETTHMVQQVDKPILIFFNEEGGKDIVWRMYSAITGMTYMELSNNVKQAKAIWEQKVGDRIKFIDSPANISRKPMERLIETVDPSLIVIDNLDKVLGFDGDRNDLRLHEIYKWARSVAKEQCPVLSVGQASDSASNRKVLSESDMADSKTSKPSELDFMIGIGRIDQEGYDNVRFLSLPKNKLRGDKNVVESMRHMRGVEVLLRPSLSIYEDM